MKSRPTRIRCGVVAAIFPNNLTDPVGPQGRTGSETDGPGRPMTVTQMWWNW